MKNNLKFKFHIHCKTRSDFVNFDLNESFSLMQIYLRCLKKIHYIWSVSVLESALKHSLRTKNPQYFLSYLLVQATKIEKPSRT